jgi:hypothetical protein
MPYTITHHDLSEIKWADAFQARRIDAELLGVGATLMVGVDAALRAEVVLRRPGVELVKRQSLGARSDVQILQPRAQYDRTAHPAQRAIAPAGTVQAVTQADMETHSATMATAIEFVLISFHESGLAKGCIRRS